MCRCSSSEWLNVRTCVREPVCGSSNSRFNTLPPRGISNKNLYWGQWPTLHPATPPPHHPPLAPLWHCVVLLLSYQHKEPERLYPEPPVEGPAAPCPCSPWSRRGRTSLSTACVCWLWKRRSKLVNFFCILDLRLAEYWQHSTAGTKSSL